MNRQISCERRGHRQIAEGAYVSPRNDSAPINRTPTCLYSVRTLESLSAKKRVFVADRQPLARFGMVSLLDEQVDLTCCGEADAPDVIQGGIALQHPDLLVTSLTLRSGDTFELLRNLREMHPDLALLVVSELQESLYAPRCILCGASGYVSKSAPLETLLDAIRCVLAGNLYLSAKVSAHLLGARAGHAPTADRHAASSLSDRELQIFQMLGDGLHSREIAASLGISVKTVDSHRENMKLKLGVHDSHELVRVASLFVSGALELP